MALDVLGDAPEEALLAAFSNGDREAARVLTLRLTPVVLGFALRMLGGDRAEAEDVAQEAMLRLWKQSASWRQGEARVTTWLYRVTVNLCLDRQRRQRSRPTESSYQIEIVDDSPSAEQFLMNSDRVRALHDALATLPVRTRVAVTLRHLEQLSNPEIADIMGTTVEAVESLTARGRRMLAARLSHRRRELGLG